MRPLTRHATASRRHRPVLTMLAAAALVVVAGCGSAETAALDAQDDPTSGATSEPTDEPTDEPTTEPTTEPTPSPTPTPAVVAPKVDECRTLNAIEVRARLSVLPTTPVSCGGAHNAQTFKVAPMSGAIRTAVAGGNRVQIFAAARRACELDLPGYLGVDDERQKQSQFDFVIGVPSAADVAAGAGWIRCDVVLKNGQTKVETLPASARNLLRGRKGDPYLQCIRSSNINIASGTFLCRDAHNWRSVSAIKLGVGSKAWPGTAQLTRSVRNRCSTAVRRYLDTSASFQYGYVLPTQDLWKYGDRWAVCFAKTRN